VAKNSTGKLFRNGSSQAVRLPREFRFEGDRVRIQKVGRGVLLQPLISDPRKWFAAMDEFKGEQLLSKGRKQPRTPRRRVFE
jgi:antitoxin VapB